jgi:hypothetical protein
MTTFLVTCDMLHHGDATELVNNIHYLLFDPLERTHDAQHSWLEKLWTAFVACFKLGMFSLAVLNDISKLIMGPFFLAHCHRSMFRCQWSCFLKNLHLILCTEALQWQRTSDRLLFDFQHLWDELRCQSSHAQNFRYSGMTKMDGNSSYLDISLIIYLLPLLNKTCIFLIISLFLVVDGCLVRLSLSTIYAHL